MDGFYVDGRSAPFNLHCLWAWQEQERRQISLHADLLEALINLKREIVLSDISNESIEKMYPLIVEAREAIAKALDQ